MNYSFNVSDFQNFSQRPQDLSFQDIINNYCGQWRNYSTYAHNEYIIYFFLIVIFGIIGKFYNPRFHFKKRLYSKDHKILKFLKLDTFEADFKVFTYLREITTAVLLVRIFQVYFIIKLYLGG